MENCVAHGFKSPAAACEAPQACPVAGACACGSEGAVPCIDMAQAHEEKLRLCTAIEAIADALPSAVDRVQCLRIANQLVPLLRHCHQYEEEVVFPVFERSKGPDRAARAASVRRLQAEHVEDECAAQDLTEILFAIGHGAAIANPEAVGFMLRAFFDSLRRHIAFEREHILPAVAARTAN
jgi:hemerythrin-like domain-containing protein